MNETKLCHWLLWKGNRDFQTAFAPDKEEFENYTRVGAPAFSSQFIFPLIFAVPNTQNIEEPLTDFSYQLRLCFLRDDSDSEEPAFGKMEQLKVALLVSEISDSIAQWVGEIGMKFVSIKTLENGEIELSTYGNQMNSVSVARAKVLMRAGIEMMSYARGLRCEWLP